MKKSRTVFIPAILVATAGLILILYAKFGMAHLSPPSIQGSVGAAHLDGGREQGGVRGGNEGLFKTLGTIAVVCGAVSYAWLHLKRRRRSPSKLVRLLVKMFDKLHPYAGYAMILLIAAHGFYFLTQAVIKDDTYTGIAAFALLLTLGVYGFLIRRFRNKSMRKIHFLLATAFIAAVLIHAGGSAIATAAGTIVFWFIIWLIDRMAKPSEIQRAA